ncbi:S-layer homology domain-containing protein [Aneurinibacillus sp. REN35]|uniref:S-layer homology domain-containing protein n=1 Tax=Aneurinibacillus sp. REN35 TaxID=3237286 RepID=UPI0035273D58
MREKKKGISKLVMTGLLSVSLAGGLLPFHAEKAAASGKFSDLGSAWWAAPSIYSLYEKQIIAGTSATTFSPNSKITRAEFASILARALDRKASVQTFPFTDVAKTAWYYDSVKQAYQMGIIKGVSDTRFAPNRAITREEAAAIIAHTFNYSHSDKPLPFKDASEVSGWAKESVLAVTQKKIFGGDAGYFRPQKNLTRAEAAVVLQTALFGPAPKPEPPRKVASRTDTRLDELLMRKVEPLLGTPYRWGGTTTSGFDCSGFTQYVFKSLDISLPRTTGQQFAKGTTVSVNAMQPGDLVFFDTGSGKISHIGIYMGNNKMAHAASGQGQVKINNIDWYLSNYRVVGVKRHL